MNVALRDGDIRVSRNLRKSPNVTATFPQIFIGVLRGIARMDIQLRQTDVRRSTRVFRFRTSDVKEEPAIGLQQLAESLV